MNRLTLIAVALMLLSACNSDSNSEKAERNAKTVEKKVDDRRSWQDPYAVLNLWGDQMRGKTIMEIGCGDGYWTIELAKSGANVIAADFSQARLDELESKAEELGLSDKIETKLITTDGPAMEPSSLDMVWTVNVYSVLPQRVEFAAKLHRALKEDGQLVIIDWLKAQTQHGPPVNERLDHMMVMDEMDAAGFMDVGARTALLKEQWVMVAQNVPPEAYQ